MKLSDKKFFHAVREQADLQESLDQLTHAFFEMEQESSPTAIHKRRVFGANLLLSSKINPKIADDVFRICLTGKPSQAIDHFFRTIYSPYLGPGRRSLERLYLVQFGLDADYLRSFPQVRDIVIEACYRFGAPFPNITSITAEQESNQKLRKGWFSFQIQPERPKTEYGHWLKTVSRFKLSHYTDTPKAIYDRNIDPLYRCWNYLLAESLGGKLQTKLQHPKNILRATYAQEGIEEARSLIHASLVLEKATGEDSRELFAKLEKAQEFECLESELLFLTATIRRFMNLNCDIVVDRLMSNYEVLCSGLADQEKDDALALFADSKSYQLSQPRSKTELPEQKANLSLVRALSVSKSIGTIALTAIRGRLRRAFAKAENAQKVRAQTLATCAEVLIRDVQKLRGGIAKLTQMGFTIESSLPFEIRDQVKNIYDRFEPASNESIVSTFVEEFGQGPNELFTKWDPTPFSLGALAQVHRATSIDGKELAVKVLYETSERDLRSDFRAIESLVWFFDLMFPHQSSRQLIKFWMNTTLGECRLDQEAKHYKIAARVLANEPDVYVPAIYDRWSSQKILSMEYVPGTRFREFVDSADLHARSRIGRAIYRSFYGLLANGYFRGDIHEGNYIIDEQGRLVMLDLGVLVDERDGILDIGHHFSHLKSLRDHDFEAFQRELSRFKSKVPKTLDVAKLFNEYRAGPYRYLFSSSFRFDREFSANVRNYCLNQNSENMKIERSQAHAFLFRVMFSLYGILGMTGAEADWSTEIDEFIRLRNDLDNQNETPHDKEEAS